MSETASSERIAIAGAGIAGLVLTLSLKQRGFAPDVFEARGRRDLITEGAFLTLAPNAMHCLATVGCAARVVQVGIDTTGIAIARRVETQSLKLAATASLPTRHNNC